jgi:hypothetical protein
MVRSNSVQDSSLLKAALEGLELQKQRIEEQIVQVRQLLGRTNGRGRPSIKMTGAHVAKRNLSPAARKRISAAQKRRWAEFRKTHSENRA